MTFIGNSVLNDNDPRALVFLKFGVEEDLVCLFSHVFCFTSAAKNNA